MRPHVSVVIPYYNRGHSLPATPRSIAAQTYADWEVIVVDDGSAAQPHELVEDAIRAGRWRVVRHDFNRGASAARNSGVRNCAGEFVAFLDSDDLWLPRKLEAQVSLLDRIGDPRRAFCVTRTHVDMGNGWTRDLPIRSPQDGEDFSDFLYIGGGFAQTSSFLLHREQALEIPFAEPLRQYEDHLFFLMAGRRGLDYRLAEEPLVVWNNDTRGDRAGRTDSLEQGNLFLRLAADCMTARARLAFQTRFLGRLLFRNDPARALNLFIEARQASAVSARDLATLALRCLLPAAGYDYLRRALTS